MVTRIPGTLFLLTVLFGKMALAPADAKACATFLKEDDGTRLFCKSYDWDLGQGLVMVNKRGMEKTALLMDPADKTAVWTSKYASITFNQYGREMPQGGMNQAGLAMEVMVLGQTEYPPKDDRPAVNELQVIQYCLDRFATIAELAAELEEIRPSQVQAALHYLACDATGVCAAVEYINGELVLTTGDDMPARTLTNNSYADSVAYLAQFVGFGGELPIPQGTGSLERFVRASALAAEDAELPEPDAAFDILAAVAQGDYSKWNIVYDLSAGRVHFRTLAMATIKTVELAHFDLDCTAPVMLLDIDADLEGDVADSFLPYTIEANRALIQQTLGAMPGVTELIVDIVATYPDTQNCTLPEAASEPMADAPEADVTSAGTDSDGWGSTAPDNVATPYDLPETYLFEVSGDSGEPQPGSPAGSGCQAGTSGAPLASPFLLAVLALALFAVRRLRPLRG